MPHISPLKWQTIPLLLLILISSMLSALWWNQNPSHPSSSSNKLNSIPTPKMHPKISPVQCSQYPSSF